MAQVVDRRLLSRVIAVINGKGGVFKTTITANCGGIAAKSGYKVLLVDFDPQGSLGLDLGYAWGDSDDGGKSLTAALLGLGEVKIQKNVRENLDVIVGGSALNSAAAALAADRADDSRETLAQVLAPIAGGYDLILIDCPPGNESLQTAAMAAARWAIVPGKSDRATQKGLLEIADRIRKIADINPDVDLLGVALCGVAIRETAVAQEARLMLADTIGAPELLFDTIIRHSNPVAQQARNRGLLVAELDEFARHQPAWWQVRRGEAGLTERRITPTASNVADDLHQLTAEIITRLAARETQGAVA